MMMVMMVVVTHDVARVVGVRDEAGIGNGSQDCRSRDNGRVVRDIDTPADQVEVEGGNAGAVQRAPDQRRFVGAVHAGNVHPEDSWLGHYRA